MKINNINISNFSAELIDRQVSTQNIESITDWFAGSNEGLLLRQANNYKSILLTFIINEQTEDVAYKQISKLTEELKKCTIEFDDIELSFSCFLDGSVKPQRLKNSFFKVTYLLKNDWAIDDTVHAEFPLVTDEYKTLELRYINNWGTTINHYVDCFDEKDKYEVITKEEVYFDISALPAAVSNSANWDELFLNLGIDINKYKPSAGNTLYGFPFIEQTYDASTAANILLSMDSVDIHYNRFSIDEEPDLPNAIYPSIIWTTGAENTYYFDLGVGAGLNYEDLSILIKGRYFQNVTSTGGNGPIFGESTTFKMSYTGPNCLVNTDINARSFKVFESSTRSGKNVAIETLESISDLPMRTYGFKSSIEGNAGNAGYVDIIFNGVSLDRIPDKTGTLSSNLMLCYDGSTTGKYVEICRVQIYDKGELIKDCIPVNGNIKNGFVNTYDVGLYDINTMEFIPWKKTDSSEGTGPSEYMPIPTGGEPEPPQPVTPELLLYTSYTDIENETVMGANNKPWGNEINSSYYPKASDYFYVVYSVPNPSGTITSIERYNPSYISSVQEAGTDKWGRKWVKYEVLTSSGKKLNQYINFVFDNGTTTVRKDFCIQSV